MTSVPIFNPQNNPNVVEGNLLVTGNETIEGNLQVDGSITATAITAGVFTPASINTGAVTATSITDTGTLGVTGVSTLKAVTATTLTSTGGITSNTAANTFGASTIGAITNSSANTLGSTSISGSNNPLITANFTGTGIGNAFPLVMLYPGIVATENVLFALGADTVNANNSVNIRFNYVGSGSTSNSLGISFAQGSQLFTLTPTALTITLPTTFSSTIEIGGSSGTTLTSGGNVAITGPATAGTLALRPTFWMGSFISTSALNQVFANGITSTATTITFPAVTANYVVQANINASLATLTAGSFTFATAGSVSGSAGNAEGQMFNAGTGTNSYSVSTLFSVSTTGSATMTISSIVGFTGVSGALFISQVL
jgi:hypothetical protein